MAKIYALRSLIYAKYDSEAKLADELGWPRQRLNKITNGTKEPDLDEVKVLAEKLDRPFSDIAFIFLDQKSPNDEQSDSAEQTG
jgi:transcriptional regulator with XRE-family HTH domain